MLPWWALPKDWVASPPKGLQWWLVRVDLLLRIEQSSLKLGGGTIPGSFRVGSGMGDSHDKFKLEFPCPVILYSSAHNARPFSCLNYSSGSAALCCLDLGGLALLGSQDEGGVLFLSSQEIHGSELPPSSYLSPVE